MPTIDAHQHFWQYQPKKQEWIDDTMAVIKKDFLPQNLAPVLLQHNIDGCIAVQADQTEAETNFLIDLAKQHNFIKGVVGWCDLNAANIKDRLAHYKKFNIVKGFRHVLQSEAPEFMLQPNFLNGIAALQQYNFTYDILVLPKHLQASIKLVQQNPNQQFVIDHIAKPYIKAGLIDEWKKDIALLAKFENVYCKISGMVTEADYKLWKPADFTPYLDVVVHAFGTNRIMYGSDWPVCLVAASYENMLAIVKNYFSSFTLSEQYNFFANNAIKFYKL
jgi:L-fuconolactonase